jgi:hypothetical protein
VLWQELQRGTSIRIRISVPIIAPEFPGVGISISKIGGGAAVPILLRIPERSELYISESCTNFGCAMDFNDRSPILRNWKAISFVESKTSNPKRTKLQELE